MRGAELRAPERDLSRQREVVDAFFAAAHRGDFDALVAVLDPNVVLRSDAGPARSRASAVVHGPLAVAGRAISFARRGTVMWPVLVNGAAGVVLTLDGHPVSLMGFNVSDGRIVEIDVISDPERLARLDLGVFS